MGKVLLVDDEEVLRTSLGYALRKEGFQVATAAAGDEALQAVRTFTPDLILLDVMLPGIDGFEVCRLLRETASDTPIIFLTAKDQATERVHGFDIGADDYVIKPFNTRELIARVNAVLRRRQQARALLEQDKEIVSRLSDLVASSRVPRSSSTEESGVVRLGDLELDRTHGRVRLGGRAIELGPAELQLLEVLAANAPRVVTRTELLEVVFGRRDPDALALLEAHVRLLREKLEVDPARPRRIVSVPGIGFSYDPSATP